MSSISQEWGENTGLVKCKGATRYKSEACQIGSNQQIQGCEKK